MKLDESQLPLIYLYRDVVDFRKSINGLAAIIASETDLDFASGTLFLFTNKPKDKIKILYWDETGFALWYKRLEKDKFKWPSREKNDVFSLTKSQYDNLLSGIQIIGHQPINISQKCVI